MNDLLAWQASDWVNLVMAVATCAAVVVALFHDWFKSKLASPKLKLVKQNFRGKITGLFTADGKQVGTAIYYHLRVVNDRRWAPAANCMVMLTGIEKRGADGRYFPLPLSVPLQFTWSPHPSSPVKTVAHDAVVDLGRLESHEPPMAANLQALLGQVPKAPGEAQPPPLRRFLPALYQYTDHFEGIVGAGDAVRYWIEVRADNYSHVQPQVFQVAWDGKWSKNLDEMERSLVIREIDLEQARRGE